MLSNNTITGGDMVGYYYMTYYARYYLLPNLKILGWSPGWFAGFPMFQFYFPLTFVLAALLGFIIPVHISFKLMTVLGIFLMPICTYFSFKLMRFKFPIPIIAGIVSLQLLFFEHYSMWGGNIPSSLAGEFSHTLSIAFMILFFGSLYRGIEEKKYVVQNAILFSLIIFSHGITTIYVGICSLFYLFTKNREEFDSNFKYLFKVYLLAFMISGFYLLPLIMKGDYSIPHLWLFSYSEKELNNMLLPQSMYLFYALAVFGVFMGIRNKDKRVIFLIFSLLLALIFFFTSTELNKLPIPIIKHFIFVRFLPIFYLLTLVIAVSSFDKIIGRFKAEWLIPLIVFFLMVWWINGHTTYIKSWIKWNYEGFETKYLWNSFQKVNDYLNNKAGSGRVEFEYEADVHNSGLGSSRAMEALPAFSRPTLIGTQFQSALNGPYIYAMECEYSQKQCPCPLFLLSDGCLPFNLESAKKHLELFNVKYLIVTTDELKKTLRDDKDFNLVYGPDELEVHELMTHDGKYTVLPKYEPVLIQTDDWGGLALKWFKEYDSDVSIVYTKNINDEDKSKFKQVIAEFKDLSQIEKVKIQKDCSIEEIVNNEEVKIKTSCINKPLLIKISYFPNWKVEGADKIYMVSPAFMMIFPKQENVRLYYGKTWDNYLGIFMTFISIIIVIILIFDKNKKFLQLFSIK
jgi:hypothetical protein